MDSKHPIVIIGAGIAGLAAAHRLVAANLPVVLLDKGRGVGGRMATRRIGEATFDHGAQFFSAKTPDFQRFVEKAAQQNVVGEWWPGIADTQHPRWIGKAGMNTVPKLLSQNLTILNGKLVTQFQAEDDGWHVITDELDIFPASALLITLPAPQALNLLDKSGGHLPDFSHEPLHQIKYHPCLAVLATLDRESNIPAPGGLKTEGSVLSWVADNFKKGISKTPSVTLHATPEFSQLHLHNELNAAGDQMLEAAAQYLQPAKVVERRVHRWLYSYACERHSSPFLQADGMPFPLLFGGDGFGVGNVEGAFVSGVAMADFFLRK